MGVIKAGFLVASGVAGKMTYDALQGTDNRAVMFYGIATMMLFFLGLPGRADMEKAPAEPVAMRIATGKMTIDRDGEAAARAALRTGGKVEAIKAYRAKAGCDLKDAKDIVEYLEQQKL